MNRIDACLRNLENNKKKMLSPYITAGDPNPDSTVPLMHQLVSSGADILEIGIPFSDPMAEGPVIQHAMERALQFKVSVDDVLQMIKTFRETDQNTPIIMMGYLNPIEQYGYENFAKKASAFGVDGTIIVDLPPEESEEVVKIWNTYSLYSIFLCSPTTSKERMQLIDGMGKGYVYYVSLKGVTGSNSIDAVTLRNQYLERKTHTKLPLMVGFGIKTPETAAQITEFADGIVIGAALISKLQEAIDTKSDLMVACSNFLTPIRQSIDKATAV